MREQPQNENTQTAHLEFFSLRPESAKKKAEKKKQTKFGKSKNMMNSEP